VRAFNLIDEKWIPCVTKGGGREELGLRDVLCKANEIAELCDRSPLVTVALHRLLLAILHRNFGPRSLEAWTKLWRAGAWDQATLEAYFEQWRDRFWLLDDQYPFYQSRLAMKAEEHPAKLLALECASGNNATLFDHSSDQTPDPLPPAQAARYLIARQAFSVGFGKSKPFYFQDSPLVRGFSVMIVGNNLFETLALNLIAYNEHRPLPHLGQDLPAWEQVTPGSPQKNGSPPRGYLDYLTWQSRRIRLIPGDGHGSLLIRRCQILQNLALPKPPPLDPFKCYRATREKGLSPMPLNPDRALWRDSHALFQVQDTSLKRPEVFNWVARIRSASTERGLSVKPVYGLVAVGLATDPGKAASIVLWRHERLPLPLSYLEEPELLEALRESLELAENTGKLFRAGYIEHEGRKSCTPVQVLASELLAPDEGRNPDKDAVRALAERLDAERPYWSQLESPFKGFLVKLAQDSVKRDRATIYGTTALPEWAKQLRIAASRAFENATSSLDTSARTLKAVAKAERIFNSQLAAILNPVLKGGET